MKHKPDFTLEQMAILVGIVLGDGHISDAGGYKLRILQSADKQAYVHHLYEVFKEYTKCSGPSFTKSISKKNKQLYRCGFTFSTKALKVFRDEFYGEDRKKIIPFRFLEHYFTPMSLAYWYLDDGSMKSKQSKATILNTHGYTLVEIEWVCKFLTQKYKLKCWPRKQYHVWKGERRLFYQIYISGHSYDTMCDLILPIIKERCPDMLYKFPPSRTDQGMRQYQTKQANLFNKPISKFNND